MMMDDGWKARAGWIGVDFDGVLVEWDPKYLPWHGPPIAAGASLVRRLRASGHEVRIFTARITTDADDPEWVAEAARLGFNSAEGWVCQQRIVIDAYCVEHFQMALPITASKDWRMITCYDDRCVQMIPNTGDSLEERYQAQLQKIVALIREPVVP